MPLIWMAIGWREMRQNLMMQSAPMGAIRIALTSLLGNGFSCQWVVAPQIGGRAG